MYVSHVHLGHLYLDMHNIIYMLIYYFIYLLSLNNKGMQHIQNNDIDLQEQQDEQSLG